MSLRDAKLVALGAVLLLGGCSYLPAIPFIGSDGPHLRNPAVDACEHKARSLGYAGVGERQSAPGKDGRYTVVLDVEQNEGYGQITCTFDPKTGADVPPRKPAGK